ncbi:hypothetical protein [Halomonas sp. AOP25-F1-15]|uniref:hypothetical protein n=1 Tax=Halomonas sp. AOP25-F1-15 TaxID=3457709 RepID=UPI0040335E91
MWKQIGIAVIAGWLPVGSVASDQSLQQSPDITGMLEGDSQEWFVLSQGDDSNASFVEFGDDINIDITGFIDPERWDAQEALSISLTVRDGQLLSAAVLQLIGTSTSPPLYTSDGGDVTVSLTHYERDGQAVHVAGTIQGMLALQVQLGDAPDPNESIDIDVTFDIEAQKIEF